MGAHSVQVPGGVDGNPNTTFSVNPGNPTNTVIVFSYLLIVVYALTLAPVCWIYAAEVWSLGTRATGMSLAAMSNWVFNFGTYQGNKMLLIIASRSITLQTPFLARSCHIILPNKAISDFIVCAALGMFTPPAFINIEWKLFIVFGVLCCAAAAWFYVFYPETCGKTVEEVELMFSKDGPHPWNTRKGESRLEAEIEAVIARKTQDPVIETHEVTERA